MKERPILFSGPMVRAILDGRKTQTRRVVKPQPKTVEHREIRTYFIDEGCFDGWVDDTTNSSFCCPYGAPGERLWVREAFSAPYKTDVEHRNFTGFYRATDSERSIRWKPSIFMPRWASRIELEITNICVERVQAISEADAAAEGMTKELCAAACAQAAGRSEMKYGRWLEDRKTGYTIEGDWCVDCIKKAAKKEKGEIDGWDDYPESDSVRWCDSCGALIAHSLTQYGVNVELGLDESGWTEAEARERFARSGDDAEIIANLAGGIGDLQEAHLGRLNQIGFATTWNTLNAKRGYAWEVNPWVWVIEFKVINTTAKTA